MYIQGDLLLVGRSALLKLKVNKKSLGKRLVVRVFNIN